MGGRIYSRRKSELGSISEWNERMETLVSVAVRKENKNKRNYVEKFFPLHILSKLNSISHAFTIYFKVVTFHGEQKI